MHAALSDADPAAVFVQLHGMAGSAADFAEVADGTTSDVNDASISSPFALSLRLHAPAGGAAKVQSCQDPGTTEQRLCATNNVQGRYTHGMAARSCATAASVNDNRFPHVEQHAALRDDDASDGWSWRSVSSALRDTLPGCEMNDGGVDCSIGPRQHEPPPAACP